MERNQKEQVGDRQKFRNWKCRFVEHFKRGIHGISARNLCISARGISRISARGISRISARGILCISAEMMLFPAEKISGECWSPGLADMVLKTWKQWTLGVSVAAGNVAHRRANCTWPPRSMTGTLTAGSGLEISVWGQTCCVLFTEKKKQRK